MANENPPADRVTHFRISCIALNCGWVILLYVLIESHAVISSLQKIGASQSLGKVASHL
jgi:hypothetical protein